MRAGRAVVDRAAWLCCCVTEHDADAPTWLVYDTAEGGLGSADIAVLRELGRKIRELWVS